MRSLATLLLASTRSRGRPGDALDCAFRVMPWDVGIATLKSDRYFAFAEAAQFDFIARTGLLWPMLAQRIRWVNLAQASTLQRPLRLWQGFSVGTRVVCIDDKHAYFAHRFSSAQGLHAQVLVKAKFKRRDGMTVAPREWLGPLETGKPDSVRALDLWHRP
jgi:acyl-CoA thioesterase FadM